ncbi:MULTISPECIES: hypothetical protein [Caproicibacterium]|uniref:Uncharacterized protein n=1 Tax=Caproicibacterium lactatifermentans TaxID=2666138 RepID=A0ABX6PUC5_9FIRM|nr:hypothetical protein [Caproicibacterium lactatifermentans]MDD4807692.1 hypothetical protein [Oscillospiraceae bacterium]QKO29859.1 hypothetical protein GKP14_01830 [Caproicibacterium lactatifermentans]
MQAGHVSAAYEQDLYSIRCVPRWDVPPLDKPFMLPASCTETVPAFVVFPSLQGKAPLPGPTMDKAA